MGDASRPSPYCGNQTESTDPVPFTPCGQARYRPMQQHAHIHQMSSFCPLTHTSSATAAALRISPCHSRQPSIISDASAADGDRSSTPSDINSPRHRTHSLCNVRAAWHPRPSNQPSQLVFISTFTLLKYLVPALLISMASGARFDLMVVNADKSKDAICTCEN